MNQLKSIIKLKNTITIELGVRESDFIVIRQTPNSSVFNLITKDKTYFIKTFINYKSYEREIQFSNDIINKLNLTPPVCYFSSFKSEIFPYLIVQESTNFISLDQLLKRENFTITEDLCYKIGMKLNQFHSLNSLLTFEKYDLNYLLVNEFNYLTGFFSNNLIYFAFAFNNSNDMKAKSIILNHNNNITIFIKQIINKLNIITSKTSFIKTSTEQYGLVHGDLWSQNIIYNEINNDVRFIDFKRTHLGNILIDILKFKLRGTTIYPYYSIEELNISKTLWDSFISG